MSLTRFRPARWYYDRDAGPKRKRIIQHVYILYSPTSSVRTPTNRVVTTRRGTCRRRGHSTARISPMILAIHVCLGVARVSRDTRVSLPRRDWTPDLSRNTVYPTPRTRRYPFSLPPHEAMPLLFTSPLSRPRGARERNRQDPYPHPIGRAVHPASTCRDADADARGMESPASRSTTVTRADAPDRLAGWLTD